MNLPEQLIVAGPGFFQNNLYVYGSFVANGSVALPYAAKTGSYTATENDAVIHATSGTFTVTLPTAVGIAGRVYVVKNSGTGTITVDAAGTETIDGELTAVLRSRNSCITIQSNGSGWVIIGAISPIVLA